MRNEQNPQKQNQPAAAAPMPAPAVVNNQAQPQQAPAQGQKSGPAIEKRLVKGENIMAKAKEHAQSQQMVAKTAVKVEAKPNRIAKPRAFFSQKDSADLVQQSEGDNMMPKPEAKEAPK